MHVNSHLIHNVCTFSTYNLIVLALVVIAWFPEPSPLNILEDKLWLMGQVSQGMPAYNCKLTIHTLWSSATYVALCTFGPLSSTESSFVRFFWWNALPHLSKHLLGKGFVVQAVNNTCNGSDMSVREWHCHMCAFWWFFSLLFLALSMYYDPHCACVS